MNPDLANPILLPNQVDEDLKSYLLNKITPFQISDHRDWEAEAERLRQLVLDEVIYKGVPEEWRSCDPEVEWTEVIETGYGYRIRKLRYWALPGLCIPALLYEPDTLDGNVPAVLNVNGHVGPPGKAIDYKQIRCINLAKRGVLALNLEWMKFGELQGPGQIHNNAACLDLCGIAGVSVFYLAMLRGLDILLDHPHTDEERVAVTGLSGGGWQTIMLSALDTRVRMAVPVAGYIGLDYRINNRGDIGDIEQNPADLGTIADYPMLTAMLAPRPALLIYNQDDDCCFQTHRAKPSVYDPILPLYKAYGQGENFQFHNNVDPGTHNYDLDNRLQFYRFFNRQFLAETDYIDEEIPSDNEVLSEEALIVGVPDQNADFQTLASAIAKHLPVGSGSEGSSEERLTWQVEAKDRLLTSKPHRVRRKRGIIPHTISWACREDGRSRSSRAQSLRYMRTFISLSQMMGEQGLRLIFCLILTIRHRFWLRIFSCRGNAVHRPIRSTNGPCLPLRRGNVSWVSRSRNLLP
jgi:dienelactone hydrolase